MQSWILSSASLVCAQIALCANTVLNGVPATPLKPVTDIIHGISITDNYRWPEGQGSVETRAWIAAQQAYTEAYFKPLTGRKQVYQYTFETGSAAVWWKAAIPGSFDDFVVKQVW